ncbi:MAG TPA: hypothetical protein VK463_18245 [Desulfomonilaceae bacterium]|nr:hypothetical protein [Desulfomonilaceae bacterium]
MHELLLAIDPFLIALYRMSGYALLDFFVGTFILASIALVIGEFTISVLFLINRKHIDKITGDVVRYQNLSVDALTAGDKESYSSANKLANEAFGKSFFMQIALSAGSLWPIFFALSWMQGRFAQIEFPLMFTGMSVGYIGVFLLMYATAYLIFKRIKYKLPYFRRIKNILDMYDQRSREMKDFSDIVPQRKQTSASGS